MITPPDDNNNKDYTSYKPFAQQNNYTDTNNTTTTNNNNNDQINQSSLEQKVTALLQLKEKLNNVPPEDKSSLVYAQQVSKDLVNDDHLLGFLHVEDFNVDLALSRLLRYWKSRHKVFGDDYILPITLHGAMKGKVEWLKQGYFVLLPELDELGRTIIYGDASKMPEDQAVEEVVKVWWYLVHVAMERPSCRKNGFVLLRNAQNARLRHFNPKRLLAVVKSGDSDFPIRRQQIHLCNYPMATFPFVAPLVNAVLSLRSRQTLTLHNGPNDRVLESLAAYSLPKEVIPRDMGGLLDVSLDAFAQARLSIERGDNNQIMPMSNNPSVSLSSAVGFSSSVSMNNQSDTKPTSSSKKRPAITTTSDSKATSVPQKKAPNHSTASKVYERKKYKTHPGRVGDRRMNKAVEARLQNPDLPYLDALIAGGFVFPKLHTPGKKPSEAKDTDDVTLAQRKNQLMRRLRAVKKNQQASIVGEQELLM